MTLRKLLIVGVGGALGSAARYVVSAWATHLSHASRFPVGTLVVNVTGCFVMGILAGLAEHQHMFSPTTRLLLMTGVLGGFTTFSAFAFETHFLGREHLATVALTNVALQIVLGLGSVFIGEKLALTL